MSAVAILRRAWFAVLLATACLMTFAASPAEAARGVDNSWTQLDNHNWPADSSNPDCSPCVRWSTSGQNGYFIGTWGILITGASVFHSRAQAAISEWSGQPYRSPSFNERSGCSSTNICIGARDLGDRACGVGSVEYSGTLVYHAWTYLNTRKRFYDGRAPSGSGGCDLRATYHHEIGHNYAEGHSSVKTALMYPTQSPQEHVDGPAQAMLNKVYGSFSGCSSCANALAAKAAMLSLAESLEGAPTLQDLGSPT